jgi:hypothetical protein
MNTDHFYYEHIKTSVAVFGSLFNDMVIKRKDGKVIPVPISYGPRDKLLEGHKINKATEEAIDRILPRMSYELMSMNYDAERKLTNKMVQHRTPDTLDKPRQTTKVPVPYNLDFNMYIVTKNLNDGWQLIEQILPFFRPSYNVRVKLFPDDTNKDTPQSNMYFDMPITLQSMTWADDYQGSMVEKRIVEWSLEFQAKINLYGPISSTKVILDSRVMVGVPGDGIEISEARRDTLGSGVEVGYANLESGTTAIFQNDSEPMSPITNLFDSDGTVVRIVRPLPDDL